MLKIERDKVYVDGNGIEVRVVCVDNTWNKEFPVIGICRDGGLWVYTTEGRAYSHGESSLDLVREVKEKKVCYINVYPDGSFLHASSPRADEAAPSVTCRRIARIRVEYEEGQFDD